MKGIFTRKKFFGPLGFMSICSIFLIGLYFFLPIIVHEAAKGSLSFLMMGVLLALVTIPSWTLNHGAFFHVTEDAHMRLAVFGYPNSDSVYYTIEQIFPDNFSLCKIHESKALINIAELPESFEEYIEITKNFVPAI